MRSDANTQGTKQNLCSKYIAGFQRNYDTASIDKNSKQLNGSIYKAKKVVLL